MVYGWRNRTIWKTAPFILPSKSFNKNSSDMTKTCIFAGSFKTIWIGGGGGRGEGMVHMMGFVEYLKNGLTDFDQI